MVHCVGDKEVATGKEAASLIVQERVRYTAALYARDNTACVPGSFSHKLPIAPVAGSPSTLVCKKSIFV